LYPVFDHGCFIPDLFQFIVHFSCHLNLCSPTFWQHF
jgi:hypothetical protein